MNYSDRMENDLTQMSRLRSSRHRYRGFVQKYKQGRLDDAEKDGEDQKRLDVSSARLSSPKSPTRLDDLTKAAEDKSTSKPWRGKRREYIREYLRWLWPHRYAVAALFVLALLTAGLEMIEPLFMRFIIDRVLLNAGLDSASRLARLHLAGALFVGLIVISKLIGVLKDYRQRLLNVRVMLSLRRSLFERLLHLPLPKLWDMKTGGILSRLTGDVDTTTGLLQLAIVSPAVSVIRLIIAVIVLLLLNWRLALTALAIIPGVTLMSFAFSRRIRPIYRSLRKDVEQIDGRVGETFSGIRVVRAFGREIRELFDYMLGRHTVLRKEMFAHRREMFLWTSWGLLLGAVNVIIVWYGGYLNIVGGASIGDIMAFQWYTFLLLNPVWNIVNSAADAEVEDAARRANAHEFIVKLPEQYETFVGERGVKLSGGQQQRLAIARAILASPQILILDEATSNLDTESEQLIQASMATLLAGRTTFVIAHRLSTIRRADLILLMEDGRVIEHGTHEQLMQARGGYYRMVLRQMESAGENGEELRVNDYARVLDKLKTEIP